MVAPTRTSSRIAITGATGYLGSALAARLASEGHRVTGLARRRSAPDVVESLRRKGVEIVRGDVEDPHSLGAALAGADTVFHCAAVIGYRRRLSGLMQRVNVIGTRNVVDACLAGRVGRLVHVSSIAAVGLSREPELLDEDAPWNGDVLRAAYFDTKHAAEQRVHAGLAAGLDAVIVNPAAIYGPSSVPSNSNNLVIAAAGGRLRFVPTGGMNVVPLETVVAGTLAAAERGATGRRYILGGENLTFLHLVRDIGEAAGVELDPLMLPAALGPPLRLGMQLIEPLVPDRLWYTPDLAGAFGRWMWFDNGRMRRELGVEPASLRACLAATVDQLRRSGRLAPR